MNNDELKVEVDIEGESTGLSEADREVVEESIKLRAAVVYEVIRQQGLEELGRSASALFLSGLAAGLSISFSMLAEGLLSAGLPDAPWKPLVDNFGYCVGFLIVVIGHQQLFTENTITAVLPTLATPSWRNLAYMLRLWLIVFVANMIGCYIFSWYMVYGGVLAPETTSALVHLSEHLLANSPTAMFTKGIIAGWLIAAMVWLLPSTEGSGQFWVIVLITYLIALADLTHVVAGSAEVLFLVIRGDVAFTEFFFDFMLPTLAGNIVGGTALFALLSYGQVQSEIDG